MTTTTTTNKSTEDVFKKYPMLNHRVEQRAASVSFKSITFDIEGENDVEIRKNALAYLQRNFVKLAFDASHVTVFEDGVLSPNQVFKGQLVCTADNKVGIITFISRQSKDSALFHVRVQFEDGSAEKHVCHELRAYKDSMDKLKFKTEFYTHKDEVKDGHVLFIFIPDLFEGYVVVDVASRYNTIRLNAATTANRKKVFKFSKEVFYDFEIIR